MALEDTTSSDEEVLREVMNLLIKIARSKHAGMYERLELLSKLRCGRRLSNSIHANPACFRDIILEYCRGQDYCVRYIIRCFIECISIYSKKRVVDEDGVDRLVSIFRESPEDFLDIIIMLLKDEGDEYGS